jgi:hypothetical protein
MNPACTKPLGGAALFLGRYGGVCRGGFSRLSGGQRQLVLIARAHHISVTELIDRGLRRMRGAQSDGLSPDIGFITGLIPADADARVRSRLMH